MRGEKSNRIREFVRQNYIEPARQRHEKTVKVDCREVLQGLELPGDRAPQVCSALKAKEFSKANRVVLASLEGPPSKQSTTVRFTFRLVDTQPPLEPTDGDPLLKLYGIAKNLFERPGDWEESIRKDREQFYGPGKGL